MNLVFFTDRDLGLRFAEVLKHAGFAVERPFTRMLLGRDSSFDDTACTYAVIGPEFG